TTRYLKLENVHMADGKFAIAGFRIFGKRQGKAPATVENFQARRHSDTRDVTFAWKGVPNAYAYNIYYDIESDKLYNCIMVHEDTTFYFRGLNKGVTYFASIQAIGETGVSEHTPVVQF